LKIRNTLLELMLNSIKSGLVEAYKTGNLNGPISNLSDNLYELLKLSNNDEVIRNINYIIFF